MTAWLLVLCQQVGKADLFSFDRNFDEVIAGDPFRYQLNDFSTTESAKIALGSMIRVDTENDMMSIPVLASEPGSSNSPPPP